VVEDRVRDLRGSGWRRAHQDQRPTPPGRRDHHGPDCGGDRIGGNTTIAAYDEDLQLTSSVSTATLTLTAAQAGPRGNDLRVTMEIVPAGSTAVGTTMALAGNSAASKIDGRLGAGGGSSGTDFTPGSGADDFTNALAAVYAGDFDFIVCACNDDTNRGLVSTHVTNASAIAEGRRRVAVCGSIEGTLATVQADAVAANNPRMQVLHLKGSHNSTGEIAAAYAAARIYGDGTPVNSVATSFPTRAPLEPFTMIGGLPRRA
jgi:phage tail sheath gpL-like